MPEWWILVVMGIFLMAMLFIYKFTFSWLIGLIVVGIGYYFVSTVITSEKMDKFDWKVNADKRQEIVLLAKENKLKSKYGATYKIPVRLWLFPFIRSNEVRVEKRADSLITVIFYTDYGLMDHYSGFMYSNDTARTRFLDQAIASGRNDLYIKPNWYVVHE